MSAFRLISLPYLLLRSTTAGGALIAGLIQTFVFARVVSPELFSIFILVGTLGVSLWIFDLGVVKVVFLKLRNWYLSGREGTEIAEHATAILLLYFILVLLGTLACFGAMLFWPKATLAENTAFALFFLMTALTLVWFAIRNLSVAVDAFIRFETLDLIRRIGHIAAMLSMLAGFPLIGALIAANLLWAVLLTIAVVGLERRGALSRRIAGFPGRLRVFFVENKPALFGTGTYALNELFVYNFPYFFVAFALGLGVPTIVLDTTFKIFRGAPVVYSAGCDIAVPRQTRAYNEHDQRSLIHATLIAAALCSVPALIVCGLLVFESQRLFALLLGPAAVMPAAITPILIILLIANLVQTVSNFLLVHTGYFKAIARCASAITVAMIAMTAVALVLRVDIIGFLQMYTAVYCVGAALYAYLAIRGPIQAAGAEPDASVRAEPAE